jgi:head-tail adaptor
MLRYFFILLLALCISLLILQSKQKFQSIEKPIFLQFDEIATQHQTKIDVQENTSLKASKEQIEDFKKDYSNIWAHLNHLYETNDVIAGKEYYTEDWFKQICLHYKQPIAPLINRLDLSHKICIKNWAWDGLVCTITDSVQVIYTFPNKKTTQNMLHIAMVLLYQGDHWRIDAIKVENQE